ncbi:MAG: hypothetical protein ACOYON_12450 [Fimbriimonas sp.]
MRSTLPPDNAVETVGKVGGALVLLLGTAHCGLVVRDFPVVSEHLARSTGVPKWIQAGVYLALYGAAFAKSVRAFLPRPPKISGMAAVFGSLFLLSNPDKFGAGQLRVAYVMFLVLGALASLLVIRGLWVWESEIRAQQLVGGEARGND